MNHMAIAREFNGKGWTLKQYNTLIEKMNLGGTRLLESYTTGRPRLPRACMGSMSTRTARQPTL
jgi:hypothetical protein